MMEGKSHIWSLAVWLEGSTEEEGVIPSSWIEEKQVRWPVGTNVIRAMKELRKPDSKWDSFKLIKVKCTSDCKQECEDYDQTTTTELSEEEEEVGQGKRRPKKKVMEDFVSDICQLRDDTEQSRSTRPEKQTEKQRKKTVERPLAQTTALPEDSKNGAALLQLPKPPNFQKKRYEESVTSGNKSKSSSHRRYRHSRSPSISPSRHSSARSWRSRSRSRSPSLRMSSTPRHRSRSPSELSTSQRSGVFSPISHLSRSSSPTQPRNDMFPMSTGRFQKRVLFLLTAIRDAVTSNSSQSTSGGMELHKMRTFEELESFEDKIEDSEAFARLKMSLTRIGGVTAVDHTRKAMEKLLHNSLMAKMNVTGKKGKYAFGKTRLYRAVMESIRDSHSGATESGIQDTIMKYLKYAPERTGGGGRKDPKQDHTEESN